jgi:hypothetical protein
MTLDDAFAELRSRNEPVPTPAQLPTVDEVDECERELGVLFHPDYRRFLLEVSDVSFNVLEPSTITPQTAHTDVRRIAARARGRWGVPHDVVPICHDNADYYCMRSDGSVFFWSHDMGRPNGEEWIDLAAWIEEVWMFDFEGA